MTSHLIGKHVYRLPESGLEAQSIRRWIAHRLSRPAAASFKFTGVEQAGVVLDAGDMEQRGTHLRAQRRFMAGKMVRVGMGDERGWFWMSWVQPQVQLR